MLQTLHRSLVNCLFNTHLNMTAMRYGGVHAWTHSYLIVVTFKRVSCVVSQIQRQSTMDLRPEFCPLYTEKHSPLAGPTPTISDRVRPRLEKKYCFVTRELCAFRNYGGPIKGPLKPISTIVLWCSTGFKGPFSWFPIMPWDSGTDVRLYVWSLYTQRNIFEILLNA